MARNNGSDGIMAVAVISTFAIWGLSLFLGADFFSTLQTLICLAFSFGIAFLYMYRLDATIFGTVVLFLCFAWPSCWPVIGSIANGASISDLQFLLPHADAWWNSRWFKLPLEGLFIGSFIYIFQKNNYSY